MSRGFGVSAALALVACLVSGASAAAAESRHGPAGASFPAEFALPNGFMPEGIAIGDEPTAYFGSRADGSLLRVDLRTGKGEVFSRGPGTPSVGVKVDRKKIWTDVPGTPEGLP